MADIKITRAHHYQEAEVKEKINQLAEKLVGKFGGSYREEGNTVHYSTTGVDASVTHDAETVEIQVKLGFLMKGLKGILRDEIEGYLDRLA